MGEDGGAVVVGKQPSVVRRGQSPKIAAVVESQVSKIAKPGAPGTRLGLKIADKIRSTWILRIVRSVAKRPECRPLKGTRVFLNGAVPALTCGASGCRRFATGDGAMRAVVEGGFEKRET